MTLHLGMPHAHQRSSQHQQEIRDAKRQLKERIRNDWDYPPLPAFQLPEPRPQAEHDEERIAGFRFHASGPGQTPALAGYIPSSLGFEPLEWREREYSSEESADEGSVVTASSAGSKKSSYKFEGPDSVGSQIQRRKAARRRQKQEEQDEEVTWNEGLAHWLARRNAWSGALTSGQVETHESDGPTVTSTSASVSASASAASTPRTSTSTTSSEPESAVLSTPSTTPEVVSAQSLVAIQPVALTSDLLIPLAPSILANHPIRKRITPELYPEIYTKIILQSRSPSVPLNLSTLTKALVQGWKDDGEWPPKVSAVERPIGKRKSNGHESALKSGVKAVGRVLRITGGESVVGGAKEKG